jgi:predicted restriction endonuclease
MELTYGLLRILEDIFTMDELCQLSTLQRELSQVLDTFTDHSEYTGALVKYIRITIFPALNGVMNIPCRFQAFETQFQVFAPSVIFDLL